MLQARNDNGWLLVQFDELLTRSSEAAKSVLVEVGIGELAEKRNCDDRLQVSADTAAIQEAIRSLGQVL